MSQLYPGSWYDLAVTEMPVTVFPPVPLPVCHIQEPRNAGGTSSACKTKLPVTRTSATSASLIACMGTLRWNGEDNQGPWAWKCRWGDRPPTGRRREPNRLDMDRCGDKC